jgi:uncharacterized OB-fold protein
VAYEKPLPRPNGDTGPFWEGCKEHQLRFQRCSSCRHVRWPPSVICPICHSSEMEWIVANGKGRIYSFVVYHVALHTAFQNDIPYVTAIVELSEGPRILTNIVGCNPSELQCDMPVEVEWDDITDECSLPKFKPALS